MGVLGDDDRLTAQFEEERPRLRSLAYRMLGSSPAADDAVQEAWLRAHRATTDDIANVPAWLTTIVARVCLNMLRARASRREEALDADLDARLDVAPAATTGRDVDRGDPEHEAVMADAVGRALLVVLDRLTPAERIAFVLHDMFDLPFDDISSVLGRSEAATRQLASRARRRVRGGGDETRSSDLARRRRVVDAYLTAIRAGDLEGLVRLFDPDVVLHADGAATPNGRRVELSGAERVARSALASSGRARHSELALVNGAVGIVMAPRGRLSLVLMFIVEHDRITQIDVVADPLRLRSVELAVPRCLVGGAMDPAWMESCGP